MSTPEFKTEKDYDPITGERCREHGIPGCLRGPHGSQRADEPVRCLRCNLPAPDLSAPPVRHERGCAADVAPGARCQCVTPPAGSDGGAS